jgi:hypothetical protein
MKNMIDCIPGIQEIDKNKTGTVIGQLKTINQTI